ncbi:hypothetical protein [Pasteurella phage vB_PmuP_PS07]|uniref:Uncharacterized protein n=1 Tax=Pasteurella phage vB_PmuP_PHB02 TaxID=2005054 RepID=A0A1Y0T3W6_9CAUD|nr:hypothetical protein HOR82_gp43 [Pasteurella phage vB_PmuP_PHB02]ARV77607.1 hypothetical protein [Pasteurella phage vB_PmuP_PHB02]UIS73865.1 hypothetical protein [Pasteurella phage vB_PmuP_PS07]UIS74017.1 hypothetical protein [Pasteurella phage vB_PmuP_PS30]
MLDAYLRVSADGRHVELDAPIDELFVNEFSERAIIKLTKRDVEKLIGRLQVKLKELNVND